MDTEERASPLNGVGSTSPRSSCLWTRGVFALAAAWKAHDVGETKVRGDETHTSKDCSSQSILMSVSTTSVHSWPASSESSLTCSLRLWPEHNGDVDLASVDVCTIDCGLWSTSMSVKPEPHMCAALTSQTRSRRYHSTCEEYLHCHGLA